MGDLLADHEELATLLGGNVRPPAESGQLPYFPRPTERVVLGTPTIWEGHDFNWLPKNSRFCVVLKGRGFKPRRKSNRINAGFSR